MDLAVFANQKVGGVSPTPISGRLWQCMINTETPSLTVHMENDSKLFDVGAIKAECMQLIAEHNKHARPPIIKAAAKSLATSAGSEDEEDGVPHRALSEKDIHEISQQDAVLTLTLSQPLLQLLVAKAGADTALGRGYLDAVQANAEFADVLSAPDGISL